MRREWPDLDRILAVRLDNVGDMVMLGPALRALKAAFPAARLTLLASPAGSQAAPLLPWVDEVATCRASWQDASAALPLDPEREAALIDDLRARRFDAAFIFTSFSQTVWAPAYACYLAGIPERVGQAKDFGGSLLTRCVKPLPDCSHQVDRNLHLLESVGIPVAHRELQIDPGLDAQQGADQLLQGLGLRRDEPFVIVAPGASCPSRRYDAGRYAAALSLVARRTRLPVILAGHPREAQMIRAIKTAARSRLVMTLTRDASLREFAALIGRARLLIGNNSGPMHLADALRCPMVILFSGSDLEEQWQPRSAPSRLLRRPTQCDPCYRFECPFHLECLDIPPSDVADACEEVLARTAHRGPTLARVPRPVIMTAAPADDRAVARAEGTAR